MSELQPCPSCRRHVAERVCRFCGHEVVPATRELPTGRMSRAAVFASALAIGACGGTKKPAQDPAHVEDDERHVQNHPCIEPDPARITELEKQRDEAKTDEERKALEQKLQTAREPVCMPYGAPPARRRIV
jgi:hypothetical protein